MNEPHPDANAETVASQAPLYAHQAPLYAHQVPPEGTE